MVFTGRAMRFSKVRRLFTTEYLPLFGKGDDGGGDTPLPIPNREVKPASADGTARETSWESRSSPIFMLRAFGASQHAAPFGLRFQHFSTLRLLAFACQLLPSGDQPSLMLNC